MMFNASHESHGTAVKDQHNAIPAPLPYYHRFFPKGAVMKRRFSRTLLTSLSAMLVTGSDFFEFDFLEILTSPACLVLCVVAALLSAVPTANAQFLGNYVTNTISGTTSNWVGDYFIGKSRYVCCVAYQALRIEGGGVLNISNGAPYVGYSTNSVVDTDTHHNGALVIGSNSVWNISTNLEVGHNCVGMSLIISDGAKVFDDDGWVKSGYDVNWGNNWALVTGTGSIWSNRRDLHVSQAYFPPVGYPSFIPLLISNRAMVVNNNGYVGGVTVTGSGSVWSNRYNLYAGNQVGIQTFVGTLDILEGATAVVGSNAYLDSSSVSIRGGATFLVKSNAYVGNNLNGIGNFVSVTGTGSFWSTVWTNLNDLYWGYDASSNRLVVSAGGAVINTNCWMGFSASSSNNSVVVTDPGSRWQDVNLNGKLFVGNSGSGNSMIISNQAVVGFGTAFVGNNSSSSNNSVLVTDLLSLRVVGAAGAGSLTIGNAGPGNSLTISNAGRVANGYGYLGYTNSSIGNIVTVTGSGSIWSNSNDLSIGYQGASNKVAIINQGRVFNASGILGFLNSSFGNIVTVSGSGSVWRSSSLLEVGLQGADNKLAISNRGAVHNLSGIVGTSASSSNNTVVVADLGSIWSNVFAVIIGSAGIGNSLVISNGGNVFDSTGSVGASNNSVVVTDLGSVWRNGGTLSIGGGVGNTMLVNNGGAVYNVTGIIGSSTSSSNNSVVVRGSGSVWSNDWLYVGNPGSGNSLVISNGGGVISTGGNVGIGSVTNNSVLVTDSGSVWSNSMGASLGGVGSSLVVSNGGKLVTAYFGGASVVDGAGNSITVTGNGSVWSNYLNNIFLGFSQAGSSLVISNQGRVVTTGLGAGYLGFTPSSSNNNMRVVDAATWQSSGLYVGYQGTSNSVYVVGGSVLVATNLLIGADTSAGCGGNLVELDSGSVTVTNATGSGVFEIRGGKFILNGGTLRVDRFVMTNACASLVLGGGTLIINYPPATLNCVLDSDGDGMPNCWEISHGLNPLDPTDANLDNDGDGFTNLQEYQAGTDPNDASSTPFYILPIVRTNNCFIVAWHTWPGTTNELQATACGVGYKTNTFAAIFSVTNTVGSVTNYLDCGCVTNSSSRFYRVRLVP
jgi:fibronectin-binding autotransporter adhesin